MTSSTSWADAYDYIESRAADHGLSLEELLERIHPVAFTGTPEQLIHHVRQHDISHIQPQSSAPELADDPDNIFLEDSSLNSAAQDAVRTDAEIDAAWEDQRMDFLSGDYDGDGFVDPEFIASPDLELGF